LGDRSDAEVVDELIASTPWVLRDLSVSFQDWKERVLEQDVASIDIVIVGSGAVGFSMSPLKLGRPFRESSRNRPSDIDLALVAPDLFAECWECFREFERRRRLRMDYADKRRMREHVYFGHVTDKTLPRDTSPSRSILQIRSAAGRQTELRGHPVNIRVYRNRTDLRDYQLQSLRSLRRALREAT
tara:strand:+ start:814 stop:1371 length:558 start_codon:yes stop_codon:yes gene_type:complete